MKKVCITPSLLLKWLANIPLSPQRTGLFFPWCTAHLGSFPVSLCADAQQPSEQEVGDLQLGEDLWQLPDGAQHLTDHTIGTAESRVDLSADACKQADDFTPDQNASIQTRWVQFPPCLILLPHMSHNTNYTTIPVLCCIPGCKAQLATSESSQQRHQQHLNKTVSIKLTLISSSDTNRLVTSQW